MLLAAGLKKEIDTHWEATKPLNEVRPVIILDLVTYLLFIKRLDELQTFQEEKAALAGTVLENPVFSKDYTLFRWSSFKDLDRKTLHQLFVKEGGALSFFEKYGAKPHVFSRFLKTPLLVCPTSILLEKAVSIVKLIDEVPDSQKGYLFDYLLSKIRHESQRQLPVSTVLAKLMVAFASPHPGDVVLDPAAGAATFLVPCEQYLKEKYPAVFLDDAARSSFFAEMFFGLEKDPLLLRMGAMRMMLHGIDDPQIKEMTETVEEKSMKEMATLILTNLPLYHTIPDSEALEEPETTPPPASGVFYFDFILNALQEGGRGVLLVPETLIASTAAPQKKMRQDLVDHHLLQAVISLPAGAFQPFSGMGACILLFKKMPAPEEHRVLFCSIKQESLAAKKTNSELENYSGLEERFPEDFEDLSELLNQCIGTKKISDLPNNSCFYVPLPMIRANNYSFKSARYYDIITGEKNNAAKDATKQKPSMAFNNEAGLGYLGAKATEKATARQRLFLWLVVIGLGIFLIYFFILRRNNVHTPNSITYRMSNNILYNQLLMTGFTPRSAVSISKIDANIPIGLMVDKKEKIGILINSTRNRPLHTFGEN